MSILVVMIPLAILLLLGAGAAFFWAVEHHQFDDLDTPRLLPLLDDPAPRAPQRPDPPGSQTAPDAADAPAAPAAPGVQTAGARAAPQPQPPA